ncbi:MAG: flagellar export protein FliJ [Gammaproteobacteria bacterium]|nr:flagellar export protein FliJ [Gammaproteobacteria bacterium]
MTRSDRFEPIKDIADGRERDAGSIVAGAQQVLQERERQLEQLKRYREDYAASTAAVTGTMNSMKLQNHRAFLTRLSDAIRQQEQAVAVAREDYERKRDAWRERRVEAAALGKAIERFKTEEQREEAQREQASLDEHSDVQRRSRELVSETGTWKIGNTGRWKVKEEK